MAVEIRNASVEPLTMPSPFQGVLAGGQSIVLSYTPAQVVGACPSIYRGFQVRDLGSGYAGATDMEAYGPPTEPSLAGDLDADDNDILNVETITLENIRGRSGLNVLIAPHSGGGSVTIAKADGTTAGFQSNATGTAVNGATPVARAAHIVDVAAFTDPPSAAEMSALRTKFNALLVVVENFGLVATS